MPETYTSLLVHCVFSTHERRPLISKETQSKLWAYMGGIARAYKMKALTIGATQDHVHLLLSLPSTIMVSKAVQVIKANSSRWMNEHPGQRTFAWQRSYGAFTIGVSQVPATIRYIDNQEKHHAKIGFDEELIVILKRHGIVPLEG